MKLAHHFSKFQICLYLFWRLGSLKNVFFFAVIWKNNNRKTIFLCVCVFIQNDVIRTCTPVSVPASCESSTWASWLCGSMKQQVGCQPQKCIYWWHIHRAWKPLTQSVLCSSGWVVIGERAKDTRITCKEFENVLHDYSRIWLLSKN